MKTDTTGRAFALATIGLVLSSAGCGGEVPSNRFTLQSAELGDAWPLTLADVVIYCPQPTAPMLETSSGLIALNGVASGMGAKPLTVDSPIWKDAPGGAKVSLGPLIAHGLELCGSLK